jgi:hypothetical protein
MKFAIVIVSLFMSHAAFAAPADPQWPCEREILASALSKAVSYATFEALYTNSFKVTEASATRSSLDYEVVIDAKSIVDGTTTTNIYSVHITNVNTCATLTKIKAG